MIKKFSLILILLSLSTLAYAQVDYQNLNPNGLINSLISNFIEEIKLVSKPIKQAYCFCARFALSLQKN